MPRSIHYVAKPHWRPVGRCLRCLGPLPRNAESAGKPGEHHEVGMKPNTVDPSDTQQREAVVVLQATELTLDG
jgi:hypothetical protein